MNYQSPPAKDDAFTSKSCEYQPLPTTEHAGKDSKRLCSCKPDLMAELCICAGLRNPWLRNSSPLLSRHSHRTDVVVYLRSDREGSAAQEQIELIHSYCKTHGFHIAQVFEDLGKPSAGLTNALNALKEADALMAVDLDRFVEHSNDRLRDLRPFIHHFFCHTKKHLITITEGIDTSSSAGQIIAIDAVSE